MSSNKVTIVTIVSYLVLHLVSKHALTSACYIVEIYLLTYTDRLLPSRADSFSMVSRITAVQSMSVQPSMGNVPSRHAAVYWHNLSDF